MTVGCIGIDFKGALRLKRATALKSAS